MYTGQSVHSTRRGNMIHRQTQLDESYKEIGEAAMCNEKNATYYTDIHRQPGLGTHTCSYKIESIELHKVSIEQINKLKMEVAASQ